MNAGRSTGPAGARPTASLGIDLSDDARHAVWLCEERLEVLKLPPAATEPALVFDRGSGEGGLGVSFVTLVAGLDRVVPSEGGAERGQDVLVRQLRAVRELAERISGAGRPMVTTLAVPALLGAPSRRILLEACERAGLAGASLLDAASAAAQSQSSRSSEPSTFLVQHLAHGGCETAVVRSSRGRTRIVAAASSAEVAMGRLDMDVLEAIVRALQAKGLYMGFHMLPDAGWLLLLDVVRRGRQKLEQGKDAVLDFPTRPGRAPEPVRVRLRGPRFLAEVERLAGLAVDNAHGLFQQHDLRAEDVDAWLWAGAGAAIPSTAAVALRRVAAPVVSLLAEPSAVALGAAIEGLRVAGIDLRAALPAGAAPMAVRATAAADGRLPLAEIVDRDAASTAGPPPARTLAEARAYLRGGRAAEASAVIDEVLAEARALQQELAERKAGAAKDPLGEARLLLGAGRPQEAVTLTHKAYAESPRDPEVLRGMMEVHAQAALALNRIEDYPTAIRFLHCAQGHDATDRTIHRAFVERHLLHAQAMKAQQAHDHALDAVEAALEFDPLHADALAAQRTLRAQLGRQA